MPSFFPCPTWPVTRPTFPRTRSISPGCWDGAAFHVLGLNLAGAPGVVYGELKSPGAKHTLLFYAHYDGQPVDKTQWASDPWQAVLRDGAVDGKTIPLESLKSPLNPEWRIYARSASDDKAPIQALLTAIDALARGQHSHRREPESIF